MLENSSKILDSNCKGLLSKFVYIYIHRRIPKVAGPLTFGFYFRGGATFGGPLLSGVRYFRGIATFVAAYWAARTASSQFYHNNSVKSHYAPLPTYVVDVLCLLLEALKI